MALMEAGDLFGEMPLFDEGPARPRPGPSSPPSCSASPTAPSARLLDATPAAAVGGGAPCWPSGCAPPTRPWPTRCSSTSPAGRPSGCSSWRATHDEFLLPDHPGGAGRPGGRIAGAGQQGHRRLRPPGLDRAGRPALPHHRPRRQPSPTGPLTVRPARMPVSCSGRGCWSRPAGQSPSLIARAGCRSTPSTVVEVLDGGPHDLLQAAEAVDDVGDDRRRAAAGSWPAAGSPRGCRLGVELALAARQIEQAAPPPAGRAARRWPASPSRPTASSARPGWSPGR